jgi:alpha-L-fucosidase 2
VSAVLSFDRPASRWLECLPLGNGAMGVMHDGGLPTSRLQLNHESAWSGSPASEGKSGLIGPEDAAAALAAARSAIASGDPVAAERALEATQADYTQAFLPFGEVIIDHAVPDDGAVASRSLDLSTAVHEVRNTHATQTTFVSAVHDVLVIASTVPMKVHLASPLLTVRSRRPLTGDHELLLRLPSDVPPGHEPTFPAMSWSDEPGEALGGAILARVLPPDAQGRHVVLVATRTTFVGAGLAPRGTAEDAAARARGILDAAEELGYDSLLAAHTADHAELFGRVRLEVDSPQAPSDTRRRLAAAFGSGRHPLAVDPGLAALLFDYGRYLTIASARPGGLPANLQGVWNDHLRPPWSSNYTININTQMNGWSAQVTDLPEMVEPLVRLVEALARSGSVTAARLYGAPGWVAHHNTDPWAYSSPVGAGHGDARWTAWPLGGAWLIRNLWDAVEFGSGDAAELWPLARGAAEFALAWHHEDELGWSTSPATSPENAYVVDGVEGAVAAVARTTAMDQQLIYDLLSIVAQLAERLGRQDDPVATAARARLPLLRPEPQVAEDGTVIEWDVPRTEEDPHHRHLSPFYGLYPGPGRWSQPARDAATATLVRRGDDSSGWSLVWKLALWARLGRGDKVSDLLRLLFRDAEAGVHASEWAGGLYPNLFAAHPPFQIDANLGFPGVLVECLLQSHDGIELLPALPVELPSGRLLGAIARPGIRVDLAWVDGELESVSLIARDEAAAGERRIRYGGAELSRHVRVGTPVVLTAEDFATG